jgi:RNA polymerase sigma-70 factor (ECF subfamily)
MIPNLDEAELMRRAMQDPAQFAPLYERYFDRIYAYCRRRTDNAQEAEDLCSQVFARALAGLHSYRGGNVAAWLFQIAHNAVAKHYRAQRPTTALDDLDSFASDTDDVGTQEDHEMSAAIVQQVASLPTDQRELLALMIDGELSSAEAGAILGKSAGAVRVQLHRVIERLRAQVRRIFEERTS